MGQVLDFSTRVMEWDTRGLDIDGVERTWNTLVRAAFLRGLEPEEDPFWCSEDGTVERYRLHRLAG